MADLEPVLKFLAGKIGGDRSLLPAADVSLVDEGILDSFGLAQLLATLEKEYGVRVDDADATLENFDTIEKIARVIDRARG
jgi:acyl carrier protein